jgi:hypothetical protein
MPSEEYEALVAEWMDRDRSRYEPAAHIAALLYNINRAKGAKPRTILNYMPADHRALLSKKKKGSSGVQLTIALIKGLKQAHDAAKK